VVEPLVWIVLGAVLAIAEIFTTTLFLIMFAAGAFAAAAVAGLGAPVGLQALVFALVSALSVAVIRPAITRHREAETVGGTAFGIEAIEGSEALVLDEVDADHGTVKIDGEVWSARSFDGTEVYPAGEHVRVIKVRGAIALVWREGLPGGSTPGSTFQK
jgi:membrane protein implicated in regulation of membrane protease activity